ncbi:MAG: PEGA domain-containing protein, partial [Planctomycetota bacterium]
MNKKKVLLFLLPLFFFLLFGGACQKDSLSQNPSYLKRRRDSSKITLLLFTKPAGARVYGNGKFLGTTPLVWELPKGSHFKIEVVKEFYKKTEFTLTKKEGKYIKELRKRVIRKKVVLKKKDLPQAILEGHWLSSQFSKTYSLVNTLGQGFPTSMDSHPEKQQILLATPFGLYLYHVQKEKILSFCAPFFYHYFARFSSRGSFFGSLCQSYQKNYFLLFSSSSVTVKKKNPKTVLPLWIHSFPKEKPLSFVIYPKGRKICFAFAQKLEFWEKKEKNFFFFFSIPLPEGIQEIA